jgi:hypothetical protein
MSSRPLIKCPRTHRKGARNRSPDDYFGFSSGCFAPSLPPCTAPFVVFLVLFHVFRVPLFVEWYASFVPFFTPLPVSLAAFFESWPHFSCPASRSCSRWTVGRVCSRQTTEQIRGESLSGWPAWSVSRSYAVGFLKGARSWLLKIGSDRKSTALLQNRFEFSSFKRDSPLRGDHEEMR